MDVIKCSHCGNTYLFGGVKDGEVNYCSQVCMETAFYPQLCPECVAETTDVTPGGTSTINGVGTALYGWVGRCPTCLSVIKRKYFCIVHVPIIPLKSYRIKMLPGGRYYGRFLPPENKAQSLARTAE